MFDNVQRYLDINSNLPEFHNIHKNEKIFIFTVNYDWLKFCLSSSLILSNRGCLIDLYFEKSWDFNNIPQDYVKMTYEDKIIPFKKNFKNKRINLNDLDDIEDQINNIPQNLNINLQNQTVTDICHKYHVLYPDIKKDFKKVFEERLIFYQKLANKFLFIFKNKKYDKYIIPVGNNYQWAVCRIILEYLNLEYISIEGSVNFLDKKILVTNNHPAPNLDSDMILKDWNKYQNQLPKISHKKINKINLEGLKKIYDPNSIQSLQLSNKKKEKINNKKKRILILPSFIHEMHYRIKHFCFNDQNDWLFSTLDYLIRKKDKLKDTEIIIRFHPMPVYDGARKKGEDLESFSKSDEYSLKIFMDKYSNEKIFTAIKPDDKINANTLDLIKVSDLILTYQSASGLEASIIGKETVCCTNCYWSNKGFSHDPKSKEEYYEIIDNFFDNKLKKKNNLMIANNFFYFFHFIFHKDFPWNMLWGGNFYRDLQLEDVITLTSIHNGNFSNFDKMIDKIPLNLGYEEKIIKKNIISNLKKGNTYIANILIGRFIHIIEGLNNNLFNKKFFKFLEILSYKLIVYILRFFKKF